MNWLIIQSNGQHAVNRYLRECFAYQTALINLGHLADVWGLNQTNYGKIDFNKYDIILCLENYNVGWIPDLSRCRALKLYSLVDLHARRDHKDFYRLTEQCDVVLHATKALIGQYAQLFKTKKHVWFPNSVNRQYFYGQGLTASKTRDVVFIGSAIKARQKFIDQVASRTALKQEFALGPLMIQTIASSRISFDRNLNRDINYRTFETIGIGTCLVTDFDPALVSLGFDDGVNCLMYESADEAIDKINHSLETGSYNIIAQAGYALSAEHTYEKHLYGLIKSLFG